MDYGQFNGDTMKEKQEDVCRIIREVSNAVMGSRRPDVIVHPDNDLVTTAVVPWHPAVSRSDLVDLACLPTGNAVYVSPNVPKSYIIIEGLDWAILAVKNMP